jgi:thiamine biosynthesis lipoprotein
MSAPVAPAQIRTRGVEESPRWSRRGIFTGMPLRPKADSSFWVRVSRRAMACQFEATLASEDSSSVPATRAALDVVDAIEDELTIFRETSAVADLNRRAATESVVVPEALFDLLLECATLHADTGGAFDITSTPFSRCWGFLARDGRLPSLEAIEQARSRTGFDGVVLDADTRSVRFRRQGIELNFGAIGKGYALDRAAARMRATGVSRALLSAGRSSLLALDGDDGRWRIDLVSPRLERPCARVRLRDAALGTSGAGEQFVVVDGVRYGHVIDPRSGWPASGIVSATVIAPSAAIADALSTAFLVGGIALARQYCADHPNVMAIMTPDGHLAPVVIGRHPRAVVEEL